MNTRDKGKIGEDIAVEKICSAGGRIVERNFFFKGGEIDLILRDNWLGEDYLCFAEVKYRENTDNGYPEEAVTYSKRKKIVKGAEVYMNYRKYPSDTPVRFDVIAILNDEVKWIKNAFTA